jgi:hypothetical protein
MAEELVMLLVVFIVNNMWNIAVTTFSTSIRMSLELRWRREWQRLSGTNVIIHHLCTYHYPSFVYLLTITYPCFILIISQKSALFQLESGSALTATSTYIGAPT